MKLSKRTALRFFLVSVVSGFPVFAAPLTLVVNNGAPNVNGCPRASFKTIQSAASYSRDGDTIYVCAGGGAYPEQVVLNRSVTMVAQAGALIQPATLVANTVDLYDNSPLAPIVLVTPGPNATGPVNATVSGFIVDGTNISGCTPSFAGIVYQDAGGAIVHNAITNIQVAGGNNGCQTGLAIYAQGSGTTTQDVAITQNSIHDYQKNGITVYSAGVNGVNATLTSNIVRGYGPVTFIAQNGIEFDSGTLGSIVGNTVSGNIYTGTSATQSTNLLIFQDNIAVTSNTIKDGDTGVYEEGVSAISRNSISNTTYDGILFPNGSVTLNTVTDSQARAGAFAIEYSGTTPATITGNTILDAYIGVANDNGANIVTTGNKYFATYLPVFSFASPVSQTGVRQTRKVSPLHNSR